MKRRNFIKAGVMGIGAMAIAKKSRALEYYPNELPRRKRRGIKNSKTTLIGN